MRAPRVRSMIELSVEQARKIAVRAQVLDAERPAGLLDTVRRLTLLQLDPIAAVAPNADLVAWSRLGSGGYATDDLVAALRERSLLELRAMIRPAEDIALYRAEMAWKAGPDTLPGWQQKTKEWVLANDACRRDILARLGKSGPLPSRELPDTCAVPWKSSGWNDDKNVTLLLEAMGGRGEVAIAGRRGRERLWDLAERVYPDDPVPPIAEAARLRAELRLRALGIARKRAAEAPVEPLDVGEVGVEAKVEGVRGSWRVDPEQLERADEPLDGRVALLSPFDRLIHDRKRMTELFGFDYQLEMYKPVAKRRWGYFALPILVGDRLVGKLDATADRKNGYLRVDAIHEDEPFDDATAAAVRAEITDLARFVGLPAELP